MKRKWMKKVPVVIAIATAGLFVFSGAVMLLWNNVVPAVFHIGTVTLWQAMGILVLSKLLFGGFRGRRGMGGFHARKRMFGKWQNMTAEEKEIFSSRVGCHGRFATDSKAL